MSANPRIIVALDYAEADAARALVARLDPAQCRLKVGKELFVAAGPDFVRELSARGFQVFLDLKFHDIPSTVAAACRAAARLGVWMLNVHALGGRAMLSAAREAVEACPCPPKLVAVTVLTSMDAAALAEVGIDDAPADAVARLAALGAACGLDGVVCSAQEAASLRARHGDRFLLVTPGIRPCSAGADDQRRVMTPRAALDAGASYLVVGRPITQAEDPVSVLTALLQDIGEH